MKEYLRELIGEAANPLVGRHIAREYLQARILSSMQRAGAMVPLAFHGGTALRLLYGLPRYSEDLDFALEGSADAYDLRAYLQAVCGDLAAENYPVDVRISVQRTVQNGFVRFRGLLHELGLSPRADEVLMIKVEVDTNPPAGAGLDITVVRRYFPLRLQHHDRASLLSGKLHAILQRPYAKGRDLYDLLWYLSDPDWPSPNLVMLNNALAQSAWSGGVLSMENWQEITLHRLMQLDWGTAINDVRPFLMVSEEADLLTLDAFTRLLGAGKGSRL
jgi:hypothetical protein